MHPLINIATKAVLHGGKILISIYDQLERLRKTKLDDDIIIKINKQIEEEMTPIIYDNYPEHVVFSTEVESTKKSDYVWFINPIDGIINFLHNYPHFCLSVAIQYKNQIEHMIVYDPINNELFRSTRGSGTFLNDKRIRVSSRRYFAGSLLSSNIGEDNTNIVYLKNIAALSPYKINIRNTGSLVLDMAYVACGRIDGFWGMNISSFKSVVNTTLLVIEAGGITANFENYKDTLNFNDLIVGNENTVKSILKYYEKSNLKT